MKSPLSPLDALSQQTRKVSLRQASSSSFSGGSSGSRRVEGSSSRPDGINRSYSTGDKGSNSNDTSISKGERGLRVDTRMMNDRDIKRSGSPKNTDNDEDGSIRLVDDHGEYGSNRAALAGKGRQEDFNYSPTSSQRSISYNNNPTTLSTRTNSYSSSSSGRNEVRNRQEDISRSKSLSESYPDSLRMESSHNYLSQSQNSSSRNNSAPNIARNPPSFQYSNGQGDAASMVGDRSTWNSDYEPLENLHSNQKLNTSTASRDSFPLSVRSKFIIYDFLFVYLFFVCLLFSFPSGV